MCSKSSSYWPGWGVGMPTGNAYLLVSRKKMYLRSIFRLRNGSIFVSDRDHGDAWEYAGQTRMPLGYGQWFTLCARCAYGLEKIAQHLSDKDFIWESGTGAWVYTNNQKPSSPKNCTSLHRKNKQLDFALCNMFMLYSKATTKTTILHCDSSWSLTVSTNKDQLLTTNVDSCVLEDF